MLSGVSVVVPEGRRDEAVTEAYSTRQGTIASKSSVSLSLCQAEVASRLKAERVDVRMAEQHALISSMRRS